MQVYCQKIYASLYLSVTATVYIIYLLFTKLLCRIKWKIFIYNPATCTQMDEVIILIWQDYVNPPHMII